MAVPLRLIPGSTIRWREQRFVVVDYTGMDAIVAREVGKRRLQRIPVNEAVTDLTPGDRDAWTPDFVSVPGEGWQTAVRRFKILKPLFEIGRTERMLAKVSKIAATGPQNGLSQTTNLASSSCLTNWAAPCSVSTNAWPPVTMVWTTN